MSEAAQITEGQSRLEVATRVQKLRLLHAGACERDLFTFFRASWRILEPTTPLLDNWHQGLIAEYLTACHLRQIKQIIFNLPPRYGKSNEITIAFPCWLWIREPEERLMFYSYADTLATKHSVDRRNLIESDWYQTHWGDRFQLASDQNAKSEFSNNKRGHMIANGMLGSGLGKGGNWLVVDDPVDPMRGQSDAIRNSTNLAFDMNVRSRLDSEDRGVKIITMQRTHDLDLTGHVLATERDQWTWVKIPAEAPKRVYIRFPISGKKIIREAGEPLQPARHSKAQLAIRKNAMGSYAYEGQYNQAPHPPGGTILKREWWKYWRALPPRFDKSLISMDAAFKGEDDSSPVCIQAWGKKGAECFLIDQVHGTMDFVASKDALEQFCARYAWIGRRLIEDKANGPAIIASLKKDVPGLIAFPVKGSKVERARAASPWVEAGNVYLPHPSVHAWVGGVVDECASFPKGATADRVDTMSQALLDFMTDESGVYTPDMAEPNKPRVAGRNAGDKW